MNIPIQATVDLIQEYQLFTFTAKQKDIGRSAVITVTANGQVIPVTEADGANIYIAKPDGTKVYNACSFDNGRVVAELTNQMLASAGMAKVELELGTASGSRITTPIFNLKVLPTEIDGTAIESSNEFTALQQALSQVGEIATMRADIGDLTKLQTTAKSSLVDAANELNSKFAPAGYGLGTTAKQLTSEDNLDNIWQNGNYFWTWDVPTNAPVFDYATNGAWGYMRVDSHENSSFTQTIRSYHEPNIALTVIRTRIGNNIIVEWVNPPMVIDVEYRTTERWNGKAVYAKKVSFGLFPDTTTKNVEHGLVATAIWIDKVTAVWAGVESEVTIGAFGVTSIEISGTVMSIGIDTALFVDVPVYFCLKYTKD